MKNYYNKMLYLSKHNNHYHTTILYLDFIDRNLFLNGCQCGVTIKINSHF